MNPKPGSAEAVIQSHRPYTREWAWPRPVGEPPRAPLTPLLDLVSDALREAGEPLPGEWTPKRVRRGRIT